MKKEQHNTTEHNIDFFFKIKTKTIEFLSKFPVSLDELGKILFLYRSRVRTQDLLLLFQLL